MNKHLALLCEIASSISPVSHVRIAAALVYKDEVISIGVCSYKTHPRQKKYGKHPKATHLHAEIEALVRGQKRIELRGIPLKKCTMYIARVKRPSSNSLDFVPALAKPCDGCSRALAEAGIINIVYTEN